MADFPYLRLATMPRIQSTRHGVGALVLALTGALGSCSVSSGGSIGLPGGSGGDGAGAGISPFSDIAIPAVVLPFGSQLEGLRLAAKSGLLFAADRLHKTLNVVDVNQGRVVAVVPLGATPDFLLVAPNEKRVLVSHRDANALSIVTVAPGFPVQSLPMSGEPFGIAVSGNSQRAFVANRLTDTVAVLDLTELTTTDISVGDGPTNLLLSRGGQKLFVLNSGFGANGSVSVVDVASLTQTAELPVGTLPGGLALTPDGAKLYVTNSGTSGNPGDSVTVIDAVNDLVILPSLPAGEGPMGIAISPDGKRAYVANVLTEFFLEAESTDPKVCGGIDGPEPPFGNTVTVIDVVNDVTLPDPIPVGPAPAGLVVTQDNARLFAISRCRGEVTVTDVGVPADGGRVILVENLCTGVAMDAGRGAIYVGHPDSISAIDLVSETVQAVIPARGTGPTRVAQVPGADVLYTINSGSDSVTLITLEPQPASEVVPATFRRPSWLELEPDGTAVYVPNAGLFVQPESSATALLLTSLPAEEHQADVGLGPVFARSVPALQRVYVANFGRFFPQDPFLEKTVTAFDTSAGTPQGEVDLSLDNGACDAAGPVRILPLPDGSGVLVLSFFSSSDNGVVSVLSSADAVLTCLEVESGAADLALSVTTFAPPAPVNPFWLAVVANHLADSVSFLAIDSVDASLSELLSTAPLAAGARPFDVVIDELDQRAYVALFGAAAVDVFDVPTQTYVTTIAGLGAGPFELVLSPDGTRLFASCYYSSQVAVVDLTNSVVETLIDVGAGPQGMTLSEDGARLYVACSLDDSLAVIDVEEAALVLTIPVET